MSCGYDANVYYYIGTGTGALGAILALTALQHSLLKSNIQIILYFFLFFFLHKITMTMACPLAHFAVLLAGLISAVSANLARPYIPLDQRAMPVLPSIDPFYQPPLDVGRYRPGAIIRHRPPPNAVAAFGFDPISLDASHQILYRTTDSAGNATATVLTVLVPHNADYTKVLSYQFAEDACSRDCAPSYAFQLDHADPGMGTLVSEEEILLVEAALEQGWVVIAPDFQGPQASYLANALAGQATLDGIRAAIRSGQFTSISSSPTVALWGYSGGSLASMWAAELQPTYAPELKIAGAAVGGAVPNITTVVTTINAKPFAGLIPSGIIGLTNQYPEMAVVVDEHLLPRFRDEFFAAKTQCYQANHDDFANKDIVGMFDSPEVFYSNPTTVRILAENDLGHHAPGFPLYVYKGLQDDISPYQETDALVDKYCKQGALVEYHRDQLSNHADLALTGAPRALSWLRDRMEGRYLQASCSTTTVVSSLLDITTLTVFPKILLDALLDLLGKPVGPLLL